jgi:molybdopterin converting factor small subunit
MEIEVELTGQLRTAAGRAELVVPVEPGATLRGLLDQLAAATPALAPHLFASDRRLQPSLLVVVNGTAVAAAADGEARLLKAGDRVGLMPPVAGG